MLLVESMGVFGALQDVLIGHHRHRRRRHHCHRRHRPRRHHLNHHQHIYEASRIDNFFYQNLKMG